MRVVILGCGYVGIELGRQLRERGHEPVGVRRSADGLDAVESAGLNAVRGDVTVADDLEAVPDADAVVFASSSGRRGVEHAREVYVEGLRTAIDVFGARESPPDRFVYTSSTSVYGDHDGAWVNEETAIEPTTEKSRVLATAERIATERTRTYGIEGTVARFAGLYGPGRYRIERYLSGPVTAGYLNMVHRDDAAGAVRFLLERDSPEELVLVVDDEPVDKWAFADWLADQCDTPRPEKRTKADRMEDADLSEATRRRILTSKRCSNDLLRELGYAPRYPTFREGYAPAVSAGGGDA